MKYSIIIICLLFSFTAFAQKDSLQKSIQLNLPDTSYISNEIAKMDSIRMAKDMEHMSSNFNSVYSEIRETDRKQKQQMWIRFGFAGLMLAVGIVGIMRRKKQKVDSV